MWLCTLRDTTKGAISAKTLVKQLLFSWGPVLLLWGFNYQHFTSGRSCKPPPRLLKQSNYHITSHCIIQFTESPSCVEQRVYREKQTRCASQIFYLPGSHFCTVVQKKQCKRFFFFSVLAKKIKSKYPYKRVTERERERESTERQRTDEQMLSDRCRRPSLVCGQQI